MRELQFDVIGKQRKVLEGQIGEILGMKSHYAGVPSCDYLIGRSRLDKNGILHLSEEITESQSELLLEQLYQSNVEGGMPKDVEDCFKTIIENRKPPKIEPMVDGVSGFLYFDKDGSICYSLHWEHYFKHILQKYNGIYKVQMPKITPHVCRHTYCSNMSRSGMNPKTLQYLMGHSDISVTLNTYTHVKFEDAKEEMARLKVI